jgi:hypothetical protein
LHQKQVAFKVFFTRVKQMTKYELRNGKINELAALEVKYRNAAKAMSVAGTDVERLQSIMDSVSARIAEVEQEIAALR